MEEVCELGEGVSVGPAAVLESGCRVGRGTRIGAQCYLGSGVEVGEECILYPQVVVGEGCVLGRRVILHSGVVVGADGFGYTEGAEGPIKVRHVGVVSIEDDVEIGANSTIDRGALGETIVGTGTKIDNLVMVAHGVRVGPGCLLVAQSGIAGSTRLGARVTIAGQSGAAGHLEIADGVQIAAKSAVFNDVPEGRAVGGVPAVELGRWRRSQAVARQLPELRAELRRLRSRVEELESRLGPAKE